MASVLVFNIFRGRIPLQAQAWSCMKVFVQQSIEFIASRPLPPPFPEPSYNTLSWIDGKSAINNQMVHASSWFLAQF